MQIIIGKILGFIIAIILGSIGVLLLDKNRGDITKGFEDLCALLMIFLSIMTISITIFS